MNTPSEPLGATRKFLQDFILDEDSMDSIRLSIRRMAAMNTRPLRDGLQGIESLLANTLEPGVLSVLVSMDAGKGLDDPSDEGARGFLKEIVKILHEELSSVTTVRVKAD